MSFKTNVNDLRSNPANIREHSNEVRRLDGSRVRVGNGIRRLHAQLQVSGTAQVELPSGEVIRVEIVAGQLQEVAA